MSEPVKRFWIGRWNRMPDVEVQIQAMTRSEATRILRAKIRDAGYKPSWTELQVKLSRVGADNAESTN